MIIIKFFSQIYQKVLQQISNEKGNKIEGEGNEFLGEEIRKKYIQEYILKHYRRELQQKQQFISSNILGFYCYLIDIVRNDKQIQLEFIKFKNNHKLVHSIKGKQIFYVLNQFAHTQSLNFNKLNHRDGEQSKAIQNIYQSYKIALFDIFLFDKHLEDAHTLFQETLKQKETMLMILGKDMVDLDELFNACKIYQSLKKSLLNKIIELIKQNKTNVNLLNLCEQYSSVIDFDNKLQSQLSKFQSHLGSFKEKLFNDPDSFIIFISIFKKDNEIIQVSSNFEKIFPKYTNKSIIGKDLNFILPQKFQEPHKKMLRDYSEKSQFSKKIKRFPLQIGIDSNGWALPLEIKIQNHQIGNDDMGICAWMKKVKFNDRHYISLQYNQKLDLYEILTMTQNLYEIVFDQPATNSVKFNRINVNHFCPAIQEYLNSDQFEQKFETIIFKPLMLDKNTTIQLNLHEIDIQEQNLYYGEFVMYKYQNGNINVVSIEIQSLQSVQSGLMKKEAFEILKNQLSFNEIREGSVMKTLNDDEQMNMRKRSSSISNNNLFYQMKTSSRVYKEEKTQDSPVDFSNLHVKTQSQQMKSQHSLLKYTSRKQAIPQTIQEQVELETPLRTHKKVILSYENLVGLDSPKIIAQDCSRSNAYDSPQILSIDSPRRFSAIQEQEALTLALSPSNSQAQSFNFINRKIVNQSLDNIADQLLNSVTSRKSMAGQLVTSRQMTSYPMTADTDLKLISKNQYPSTLTNSSPTPLNSEIKSKQRQVIKNIESAIISSNKQAILENSNVKLGNKTKKSESQVNSSSHSKNSSTTQKKKSNLDC